MQAIGREPAVNGLMWCVCHIGGGWFAAGSRQIAGKPSSYALRAEA